ncbi:MAG: hypothetical protein VR64_24720 [Desulfatitalea sp. BRH_c12]|nr:MAG: hypothetical protein VR64_24720 [Desulfatitalea sp. BRH_c12]
MTKLSLTGLAVYRRIRRRIWSKIWPEIWFGLLVGAVVGGVLVQPSFAEQCLAPSPTLLKGEDPYAPIKDRDLTPGENDTLKRLYQSLTGNWRATAETFFCTSADDPDDVDSDRATGQAKVVVDYSGDLTMTAEFYSPRQKSSHQEILHMFQSNNRLRIEHDTGAGDVELIDISGHTISCLYRRIVPMGKGSSRREFFFTLHAAADAFTIEQQLYIQGRLSSGQSWHFKR